MKGIYWWHILFFVLTFTHGRVLATDIRFLHIDVMQGLSQSSVYAIAQDYKGFIWIGTKDGLNKYDSRKIKIYRNNSKDSTSIGYNHIHSILEDSRRRLWVGTLKGLNLYDRDFDRFRRIAWSDLGIGEQEPLVYHIMENSMRQVYLATSNGIYRIKEAKVPVAERIFDRKEANRKGVGKYFLNVNYIYESPQGKMWICAQEAVISLRNGIDKKGNFVVDTIYRPENNVVNTSTHRAVAILEMSHGKYWVATKGSGIKIIDEAAGKISYLRQDNETLGSLPSDDVRSIFRDKDGRIWVGTFQGLSLYEGGKFHTFKTTAGGHGLNNSSVRPIFQDRRGSLWVGTYYGGVSILDHDIPSFTNYSYRDGKSGLSFNVVSSFVEQTDGTLIIGTEGGGVSVLDRQTQQFSYIGNDPHNKARSIPHNVKALCLDRDGDLWIGTYEGGLYLKRKGKHGFEHFESMPGKPGSLANNSVYALIQDQLGRVWVGTFGGGVQVAKKFGQGVTFNTLSTTPRQLKSDIVRVIFEDSKQNLWIGTQNGIFLKRRGSDIFTVFKQKRGDAKSLNGNDIHSIHEDKAGFIWIGTYMSGLDRYNPHDSSFTHFDASNGLPVSNIFGILSDRQRNLWLSTNDGIVCFNPITGAHRRYNHIDGLVGNEFIQDAALELSDGSLAFGSFSGFTIFHPDSLHISGFGPPVVFTGLKLFNRTVDIAAKGILPRDISMLDELTFHHDQNVFSLEFAVLNYVHAERNAYAYMLKGFDLDWNYVDVPTATYTNLDAGEYELWIKGANNDGVWANSVTVMKIHILPAPWKTWWAYTLYTLVLVLLGILVFRFLQGRNSLRQKLLVEQLTFEQQKKAHEEKLFFFSSISHEIRTPLTLILGPLEKLGTDHTLPKDAKNLLHTASKHANRLLKLVNELLLFQKIEKEQPALQLEKSNLLDLVKNVYHNFTPLADNKQIDFSINSNVPDNMEVMIDADKIEKVLTNLLANAFKFTDRAGKIKIDVVEEPDFNNGDNSHRQFYIAIWDTGKGIDKHDLPKIFERFYQSSQTSRSEEGFGVGLALVKSLVELHGGHITVDSGFAKQRHDFNTLFKVILPLSRPHIHNFAIDREQAEYDDSVATDVSRQFFAEVANEENSTRPAVLIVEDNVELRRFIRDCLAGKFQISEAGNGIEALSLIEEQQPDIILTDVMMPEMDGINLLKAIKGNKSTDHIPVLLLTARTAPPYELEAFHGGTDDYITKPFSIGILLLKIENILRTRNNLEKKFVQQYLVGPQRDYQAAKANFLAKIVDIIEDNLSEEDFTVQDLADKASVSRTVLYRRIKDSSGMNLIEFITVVRLKKAAQMLQADPNLNISEVAYKVGFSDPKYFSKSFKKFFNQTPTSYQKNIDRKA